MISTSPWISNVFKLRLPGDNCLFITLNVCLCFLMLISELWSPSKGRKTNQYAAHFTSNWQKCTFTCYCAITAEINTPSQDQWPHFIGSTSFPIKSGVSKIPVCIPVVCWQVKQWINYYCAVLTSVFHIEHDCGLILIQMFNCFGKQHLPAASSYVLMYLYTPE